MNKIQIGVIGVGRLGICFALLLEKAGYNIVASDIDKDYVDQLNKKQINTHEPSVCEMLKNSVNINFTTSNKEVFEQSKFIYVMVATPSRSDGSYDISAIEQIVDDIQNYDFDCKDKTLVIGCTVNPGDCNIIQQKLSLFGINVLYNPEFIAQGSIIDDLQNSDLVLIGGTNQVIIDEYVKLYSDIQTNKPNICVMSLTAAEIVKISINSFLTFKISFANMIGQALTLNDLDQDIEPALSAIGNDSRIGTKYLKYGFGYGGPCLPRDNRSLSHYFKKIGLNFDVGNVVDKFNQNHVIFLTENLIKKNKNNLPFFIESITYKKNSDILVESQPLQLCQNLLDKGLTVYVRDDTMLSKSFKNSMTNRYKNLYFISRPELLEKNINVYEVIMP